MSDTSTTTASDDLAAREATRVTDYAHFIATSGHGDPGSSKYVPPLLPVTVDITTTHALWDGKQKISLSTAKKLIEKRLLLAGLDTESGNPDKAADWVAVGHLSSFVTQSIPVQALTQDFVNSIDLRPFAAQADKQMQTLDQAGGTHELTGTWARGNVRAFHNLVANLDAETKAVIDKTATSDSQVSTAKFAVDPTKAGTSPAAQADAYKGIVDANPSKVKPGGFLGNIGADSTPAVTFSEDDVRRSFSLDVTHNKAIMGINNLEAGWKQSGETFTVPKVDIGLERPLYDNGRPTTTARLMSPTEASLYITGSEIKPSEISALQQNLVRAGYLDNTNGARMDPGNAFDSVTQDAYQRALADSLITNTPLPDLLQQKATARTTNLPTVLGGNVDAMFNHASQSMFGRDLSVSEKQILRDTLTKLSQTQGIDTSNNPNTIGGLPSAQVANVIADQIPNGGNDQAQGQAHNAFFSAMASMPGTGR